MWRKEVDETCGERRKEIVFDYMCIGQIVNICCTWRRISTMSA